MAKNSSIDRPKILANVLIQIATVLLIVVLANYLAFKHYRRWDFSHGHKYTLSRQTRDLLAGLKKPVKFIVFFSTGSDIARDVGSLVKEYAYASRQKLSLEVIDPYMNLTRGREVSSQYKLGTSENVVVIDYDGHSKTINAMEMAEYEPALNPIDKPRLKAFKGEQVLTAALLEVTEQGSNKMYGVSGHGETGLNSEVLTGLKTFIERQNIKLESLNLADVEIIPVDAKTLLIAGPKYDFSESEIQMLRTYWNKRGRLLVLLDPGSPTPRLAGFLEELGILVHNDRVLKTVPYGPVTGVLKEITGDFVMGSPVTGRLQGVTAIFLGGTQSLTLDPERVKPVNIKLLPLVKASKGFWADVDYEVKPGKAIYVDPKVDTASPIVAASAEKGALSDERMRVASSRTIVIGNCSFIRNDAMTGADLDFVLSTINWLLDREYLIGIAPKPMGTLALSLSEEQIGYLALLTIAGIPGAAAVLGVLLWLRRRR